MEKKIYGRVEEIKILRQALSSSEAEMISVVGRRRVGKTFLVKTVYAKEMIFELSGIQYATSAEQLQNFAAQLTKYSAGKLPLSIPKNWLEAMVFLTRFLDLQDWSERKVVFFDELPWLATHRSGFLKGLSYFWNSWAVEKNIVVVICGSAASWMIQKVVNNRGGLHNRITKRIHLEPFTLSETEDYLRNRNIYFDRYQLIQLYMAMGGIPHYLKEIVPGDSATQNINKICFSKTGLLRTEFPNLYASLFENANNHIAVIKSLAKTWQGLTRQQIVVTAKLPVGGLVSRVLEELSASGFIQSYRPFDKKKKDRIYRLTDEYSLFYLHFIEGKEYEGEDVWNHLSQTSEYQAWAGYAFESVCLKHIPSLKKALGISGIYSRSGSFIKKGTADSRGLQIDLLIDRKDQVINLFEIKFYNEPYTITKAYAEKMREQMHLFKEATKTRKQLFWVLLAPFGVKENEYSGSLNVKGLSGEVLFG